MRNAALMRAIAWRRMAALRRRLPSRSRPNRAAAGVASAPPSPAASPEARSLTPIVVDYFGRDGSTAMMRLLASSPEIVVDGGYPFEASRLADALGTDEPDLAWAAAAASMPGAAAGAEYYAEKMLDVHRVGIERIGPVRLLVMLRDPRDTWLSIESFSRAVGRVSIGGGGDSSERLDRFVRRQRRRLEWIAGLEAGPGQAIVRYEELVGDVPAVAARLSRLLGVELDPRAVSGDFRLRWVHGTSSDPARSVGRWRRELDSATAVRLRADLGDLMEPLGFGD